MLPAFATGALASALVTAGLSVVILWVGALIFAGGRMHDLSPVIAALVGLIVGLVVLVAERIAWRRTRRAWTIGEPWAYRGRGGDGPARRYGDPRG